MNLYSAIFRFPAFKLPFCRYSLEQLNFIPLSILFDYNKVRQILPTFIEAESQGESIYKGLSLIWMESKLLNEWTLTLCKCTGRSFYCYLLTTGRWRISKRNSGRQGTDARFYIYNLKHSFHSFFYKEADLWIKNNT